MSDLNSIWIGALRWGSFLHLGALSAQMVTALALLAGQNAFQLHSKWAWGVIGLAALQALVALFSKRLFLIALTLSVLALEALQMWLGLRGQTDWHALNAMVVWALSLTIGIRASVTGTPAPQARSASS